MNAKLQLRTAATIAAICITTACAYVRGSDADEVTGPVGESVTGSEVAGKAQDPSTLGRLLGRMAESNINQALNDRDLALMSRLAHSVLDHGADDRSKSWRNGRSRHYGSFVAMSTWRTSDRVECRRFTNTIHVGKTESRASGTACRLRDGTWTIMG